MDKNAIKKYAVWARRELIEKVTQKAQQFGVEDGKEMNPNAESIGGTLLTDVQKKQRQALIRKVNQDGFQHVMEEVAYTWFNRFIALRFMEVNGYLPSHVRVFTDDDNNFKPQILSEALHLELQGLDQEKVYAMKSANLDEELFKYLLIVQCNDLNSILPGMFQKIADYTELLLPNYLLRESSVIEQMISMIPQEDWTDQVQIIGWLYQYYNSEPKDQVFADLKKNQKITKEKIPAATQLFTPDWIVRYMVENSLGRLWLEGHPDNKDKFLPTKEEQDHYIQTHNDDGKWHYYLEEAEQEPDVQKQLDEIHREYSVLKPEDIRCIDPCMGSGHILCYLFDALVKIYEDYGYSARDAASSIVEHNLWGLDIDERAAQLAYFAIMMKARQYDRRFFMRGVQPHVYGIHESNNIEPQIIEAFENGRQDLKDVIDTIISSLYDAKEYGSIIKLKKVNFDILFERFTEIESDASADIFERSAIEKLLPLVYTAQALSQTYHIAITNPPYMGSSGMSSHLASYIKREYPEGKADLFAAFITKCGLFAKKNYYQAMVTQHAWMFLSSYENLRRNILVKNIVNMVHLGARAFEEIGGEVVQTTAFVIRNSHIDEFKGKYCRLVEPTTQQGKESLYLQSEYCFTPIQSDFLRIPGCPIAYWIGNELINLFSGKLVKDYGTPRQGLASGDNDRFLRLWHEVSFPLIGIGVSDENDLDNRSKKYAPHNKGGQFRKWYGNLDYVIRFSPQNRDALADQGNHLPSRKYYFKTGFTWSDLTTGPFGARYIDCGAVFDTTGPTFFVNNDSDKTLKYILGYFNSVAFDYIVRIFCSGLHFSNGVIAEMPCSIDKSLVDTVVEIVNAQIELSKSDWSSYETSWNFRSNQLVRDVHESKMELALARVKNECNKRFNELKSNEEELNRIFIEAYGLKKDLKPEENDRLVSIHRIFDTDGEMPDEMRGSQYARTRRDEIISFISYAVGCTFGRYSLDYYGIAFAGGTWDSSKYKRYIPDPDNIIPICDDDYFEDDIVGRFVKFVEVVYGKDTLEENLKFIADALGGKGTPREVIRNYFLNDFYKDHCKTYQKRPIYWLFDSGKKNGFKCLIYMHRYQPDTIARIRTDYVHEQQSRYRTAIEETEQRLLSADGSNRIKLNKKLKHLQEQDEEIHVYEEKIHHLADQMISIDLDDGVKHNYAIFQDVLAKIK